MDKIIDVSDFLPIYEIREPDIMWFLGAGASASSGIPTAWDMIWDFKARLYCKHTGVRLSQCQNYNDRRLRNKIQQHFNSRDKYPERNSPKEYSFYFKELYKSKKDRQRYISEKMEKGSPSYGHRVLSSLMYMDMIRIAWTTNFDRNIEDAAINIYGSSTDIVVSDLDDPERIKRSMNRGKWPIVGKLHGDFRSTSLKNTRQELRDQEKNHKEAFRRSLNRFGLAVVGYSGRDDSVMEILEDAVESASTLPEGLFWFFREQDTTLDRVHSLIEKARSNGIEACLVRSNTFNELMGDIFHFIPEVPDDVEDYVMTDHNLTRPSNIPDPEGDWPILRFNGLLIDECPHTCKRIGCNIGGVKEVRSAIKESGKNIIATRSSEGVLAFGSDSDIEDTFSNYEIDDIDLYQITDKHLSYDSMQKSLIYESLASAIDRCRPVNVIGKSSFIVQAAPEEADGEYDYLSSEVDNISGTVSGTNVQWTESIRIRLENRLNRLWLLLIPNIVFDPRPAESNYASKVREFERERHVWRFNAEWNSIIEGWLQVLVGTQEERNVSALGITDGVDASFALTRYAPYSKRAQ